jgi:adenine-specific DNA methylase
MPEGAKKSMALFALYQACLAKRPFNLFHRANLSLRTADVQRSFGNKATWEKPFVDHFAIAAREANRAVFDSSKQHRALCGDFLEVRGRFDLVYMDPPYLNRSGQGVNYLDFYHFLEGLTEYSQWPAKVTRRYKHRPYFRRENPWNRRTTIGGAFDNALERYRDSIIVISYRADGVPSVAELFELLERHGRRGMTAAEKDYKYVLSRGRGQEVLLVSEPPR